MTSALEKTRVDGQDDRRVETSRISYRDRVIPAAFGLNEQGKAPRYDLAAAIAFTFADHFPTGISGEQRTFLLGQFYPIYHEYVRELLIKRATVKLLQGAPQAIVPEDQARANQLNFFLKGEGYSEDADASALEAFAIRRRGIEGLVVDRSKPVVKPHAPIELEEPGFTMRSLPRRVQIIHLPLPTADAQNELSPNATANVEQIIEPASGIIAAAEKVGEEIASIEPEPTGTTEPDADYETTAKTPMQAVEETAVLPPDVMGEENESSGAEKDIMKATDDMSIIGTGPEDEVLITEAFGVDIVPPDLITKPQEEHSDENDHQLSEPELWILARAIRSTPDWGRLNPDKQHLLMLLLSEITTVSSQIGRHVDKNLLNRRVFDFFHDGERAKLREDRDPDVEFMVSILDELAEVRGADKRLKRGIRNVKIR